MRVKIRLLLLLSAFIAVVCKGADIDTVSYPLIHTFSANVGLDYVAPSVQDEIREHVPSDQRINVNTALPISLRYSFSFTDPSIKHFLRKGYQGIGAGVLNFGAAEAHGLKKSNKYIGYPVSVYIFQGGPVKHFTDNLYLNYEWNFGAAFGWKPYSQANHRFSLTSGSSTNAYLHLNLGLVWQIDPHTSLFSGIGISHFSNGNTSFPNPGINSIGLRLGMAYTLNPKNLKETTLPEDTTRRKKLGYDITLWGASRRRVYRGGEDPVLLPGHFACAGLSFAPMVALNKWWRVGGSADIQWDQSSDMKRNYISGSTTEDLRFSTPNFFRQLTVGISAHGELRMPIFAVNVGVGVNVVAPWENRGTYQNITLKTYLCDSFFLNVGYQLRNFHQQSSLMLGAGITL